MGTAASTIREEAANQANEQQKATNELLKQMFDSMQRELDMFYEKTINNATDTKLLPVDKVISRQSSMNAITSSQAGVVNDLIDDIVGIFSKGPSAEGIGGVAKGIVKAALGASKGSMSRQESYSVSLNTIEGIVRHDMLFVSYNCESDALITVTQSYIGWIMITSSIDIKGKDSLDLNTLKVIIGESYPMTSRARQKLVEDDFYWNIYRVEINTAALTEAETAERSLAINGGPDPKDWESSDGRAFPAMAVAYNQWDREVEQEALARAKRLAPPPATK